MNAQLTFTGLNEIDDVIRRLPESFQHSIVGSANYMAAKPLVEREKQLAPVGATHNLVDSIGATKTNIRKANTIGEVKAGPRVRGKYRGYHASWNEFGTKQRTTKKGANRGIMSKRPFAKPAFDATKSQIEKTIALEYGKSVIRTMKKYLK